jgi:isoquinoline 1-oxidoreductase beta subunit
MTTLSRRRFLKTSAQASGGLIVAIHLPGCAFGGALPIDVADDGFVPNAFLQITQHNEIIFYCPSDEMGQGIRTGLATVIGEELDVHPASMTVVSAGSHEDYNNPEYAMQLTGGSNAVRAFYLPLRQIGADTRALILQAAAQDLGIPTSQLTTRNATVIAGDRHYPYGDFLVTASSLPLPENTTLKNSRDFQFIGQEITRVDAR